ncbi:MAG: DUF1573 domain-containing protein [Planctomycetota bacterium]
MKRLILLLVAAAVGSGVGAAMASLAVGPMEGDQLLGAAPAAVSVAAPSFDAGEPRVAVELQEYNFGSMIRGERQSHRFVVKNVGDGPLTLTPGETTCKCTSFTVDNAVLPPGGSTEAEVTWEAKVSAGPFRQTANLETNDPRQPLVPLSVAGEVLDASDLDPQEFVLGRMGVEDSREVSLVVMTFDDPELEVTATPPQPVSDQAGDRDLPYRVEVAPLPTEELPDPRAKAGAKVTLIAGPRLPIGPVREWVTLQTNLKSFPSRQVPIFGRVEGDMSIRGRGWSADTGVLALGFIKREQGRSVNLLVSVKGPDAAGAKLSVDEIDPPELLAELGEPRKVRDEVYHWPLKVAVPPGTPPMVRLQTGRLPSGKFQFPEGRVRLASDLPSTPELELGVRFAVEASR